MRMKAAVDALPFERPKLSATAHLGDGGDFAERLEAAIARSIEAKAKPPPVPMLADRRRA
jgi:hypothetical protein